ncbi:MAG: CHAD domain-containing protein [Acidimicrobiales bacterium]
MSDFRGTDDVRLIVRVLVRGVANVAREEITTAEEVLRKNRLDGDADDPGSVRKLRIAIRRFEYELEALTDLDETLNAEAFIRQLHEIGRPLGRLRDAEILESRVLKALGDQASSVEGRQLMARVAEERREMQRSSDALVESSVFQETLTAISGLRTSLPSNAVSPAMARPVVQEAVRLSWRNLRQAAKKAKNDESDELLHALRRTVKRTVYLTRAFSYVLGPSSEEFTLRLISLQKILGRQHDHVTVSEWLKAESKREPQLRELMYALASEERDRADGYTSHWVRYWKSVRDLHPNETVLTTYSFFD